MPPTRISFKDFKKLVKHYDCSIIWGGKHPKIVDKNGTVVSGFAIIKREVKYIYVRQFLEAIGEEE